MLRCCITYYQTDFYCLYLFLHALLCLDAKIWIWHHLFSCSFWGIRSWLDGWCHHCGVKPFGFDYTVWKGNSLTALTACHIFLPVFSAGSWWITLDWFSKAYDIMDVFVSVEIVCANGSGTRYTFTTLHVASIRPALPSGLVRYLLPYLLFIWTAYIQDYCYIVIKRKHFNAPSFYI